MSLSKLLSLLTERKLFLCQVARLPDKFEGSLPREFKTSFDLEESLRNTVYRRLARARFSCCVSCWNGLDEESYALWQIYGGNLGGVAIRSSVIKLNALAQAIGGALSDVEYVKYDSMQVSEIVAPILWKRRAFQYEQEMRLWVSNILPDDFTADDVKNLPVGVSRDCDPSAFIEEVLVSPFAERWYVDAVIKTVRHLGFSFSVRQSSLADSAVHWLAENRNGQMLFHYPNQAP